MKLSALTYVTNPLSTGYLVYLPAIQSFLDAADEVIVVDGGSTDGSIERLSTLRGHEKLKVISSDQTFWGPGDAWERPQFAIQRQTAFETCTGDWAINFDADHVLPDFELDKLLRRLHELQDRDVLYGFRLVTCSDGRYQRIKKIKRWCINKRLAAERGINIGYGVKDKTGGNERPITLDRQAYFVDPVTGVNKYYYVGDIYPMSSALDVTLYKYDHFFFTSEQLQQKLQRFENMRARWAGRPAVTVAPDERPYRLIDPWTFLRTARHPRAMQDFLSAFAAGRSPDELDIVGLRSYPEGWKDRLLRRLRALLPAKRALRTRLPAP